MVRAVVGIGALAVLAVLAVLPGCGSGDAPAGGTRVASPPADETGVVRTDWWFGAPPVGDRLEIVVYTGSSECVAFERVDVDESADAIRVHAFVEVISGQNCTDDYTIRVEEIVLAGAIGDRPILGCLAPPTGLRAPDIDHDDTGADCAARIRPGVTVPP